MTIQRVYLCALVGLLAGGVRRDKTQPLLSPHIVLGSLHMLTHYIYLFFFETQTTSLQEELTSKKKKYEILIYFAKLESLF